MIKHSRKKHFVATLAVAIAAVSSARAAFVLVDDFEDGLQRTGERPE
jgi:hypothetical protein